jgi:hypothetical protein
MAKRLPIRVMTGRREGSDVKTLQRWIAGDFRAGLFRTKAEAARAIRRDTRG